MLTNESENVIKSLASRFSKSTPAYGPDLYQEGCLAALEKLGRHDPDKCAQHTFVWKVARDAMVDFIRREERAGAIAMEDLSVAPGDTAEDALDRLAAESVDDTVEDEVFMDQVRGMLTGRELEVMSMRLQGLSFAEIARALDMTSAAARKAASRAMSHIRRFVG